MDIKLITSEADFNSLRDSWNYLYQQIPYLCPFSSFNWNRTWWKHYGQGQKLYIVAIYQDNNLKGLAPLGIFSKKGLKILKFLGSGNSDYLDFLFQPGIEKECLKALIQKLQENFSSWDICDLVDISENSPNFALLKNTSQTTILPTLICPYLSLTGTFQEYLNQRSSNFRYDLKRKLKKAQQYGEVSFEIAENLSPQTIPFEKLASIYENRWSKKDTNATIRNTRGQEFLKEITNIWSSENLLKIPLIRINGQVAAFCLGFTAADKFFYYIPSFDPAFNPASPGKLLIEYIINNFSNLNVHQLDFMKGEERYKLEWAETYHQNYRIILSNSGLRSQLTKLIYLNYFKFRNWARTSKFLRWLRFNALGYIKNIFKKNNTNTSHSPVRLQQSSGDSEKTK